MEDERICSVCGCVLREDEQTEIDGELICDSCAEEQTVQCDHCLDRIWLSDAITDGRTHLCEGCYDDHYRRCECCGRILHDDDVVIRQIVISDNPVIWVLEKSQKMQTSPDNLGLIGTENIVCYTLRILERYGVISSHKSRCIIQFERDDDTFFDSSLHIINDFRTVLSKLIEDGEVRVINQRGGGFFRERHSAVLDSEYINLTIDILNKVVSKMKTTKRRNIVLKTMESCGKLHSNNAYKERFQRMNFANTCPRRSLQNGFPSGSWARKACRLIFFRWKA